MSIGIVKLTAHETPQHSLSLHAQPSNPLDLTILNPSYPSPCTRLPSATHCHHRQAKYRRRAEAYFDDLAFHAQHEIFVQFT